MPLYDIERVRRRDIGNFLTDFIRHPKPVIIRDLHRGEPIDRIRDEVSAVRSLGSVRLLIGKRQVDLLREPELDHRVQTWSLEKYFGHVRDNPDTPLMCVEQDAPAQVTRLYRVPDLASINNVERQSFRLYASRSGLVAPLHFDWDLREVLFTQLCGSKRIFLIPPHNAVRLLPWGNISTLRVHELEERERLRFFAANDAHACVLEPGETLYMPMLWWHTLESIGTTLSTSVRFGKTPFHQQLYQLPIDYLSQNFAHDIVDRVSPKLRDPALFDEVLRAFYEPCADPLHRFDRLEQALGRAFRILRPDAPHVPLLQEAFDLARKNLRRAAQASQGAYADHPLPAADFHGPATSAQVRRLERGLRGVGDARRRTLLRSFGYPTSVRSLRGIQAHILLDYLRYEAVS